MGSAPQSTRGSAKERNSTLAIAVITSAKAQVVGYACHTPVKAKDYVFHPYQKR
jgi:predicted transcriptional regulator